MFFVTHQLSRLQNLFMPIASLLIKSFNLSFFYVGTFLNTLHYNLYNFKGLFRYILDLTKK